MRIIMDTPGDALMLATHKHGALPGQLLSAGAVAVLLTHLLEPRVDILREETWRYQIRVFCISQKPSILIFSMHVNINMYTPGNCAVIV